MGWHLYSFRMLRALQGGGAVSAQLRDPPQEAGVGVGGVWSDGAAEIGGTHSLNLLVKSRNWLRVSLRTSNLQRF